MMLYISDLFKLSSKSVWRGEWNMLEDFSVKLSPHAGISGSWEGKQVVIIRYIILIKEWMQ